MFGESTLLKRLAEKVWRMNRSAKGLSMITTNLDGFSLANRRRFAKFAKLSPRQTFPLYGISNLYLNITFSSSGKLFKATTMGALKVKLWPAAEAASFAVEPLHDYAGCYSDGHRYY